MNKRFYSVYIHLIWIYRCLDIYYPCASITSNTAILCIYGIIGGADYILRMQPIWKTNLHAVGERTEISEYFSIIEFMSTYFASVSAAYWMLPSYIPTELWIFALIITWISDKVIAYLWKKHLSRLKHATFGHLPEYGLPDL